MTHLYSLGALLAASVSVVSDATFGGRVTSRGEFWIALLVMFVAMLAVNGYLTARPIVLYAPDQILGLRLWTIPLEDFLYGFGFITLTLSLWEKFR